MEATTEQAAVPDAVPERDEFEEYLARERAGLGESGDAAAHERGLVALDKEIAAYLDGGVVLDGRLFRRTVRFSVHHDVEWHRALRDAGLLKAGLRFDPLHDDREDETTNLIIDGFSTGALFTYMGCALTEEVRGDPVTWSPAVMRENAECFRQLRELDDQSRFYTATSYAILDFFLNAAGSWRIFLKYLSRAASERMLTKIASEALSPEPEATTTSASGKSPSAASLDSPDDPR